MKKNSKNSHVEYELHDFYRKKDGKYVVVAKILGSARGIFKIPAITIASKRRDLLEKFSMEDTINIIGIATTDTPPVILQKKTNHFKYFSLLAMLFGCALLATNVASSKLINIFGNTLTGGMLPYLITYSLSGIITEVYGFKRTRQLIWGSIVSNLVATLFIWLAVIAPPDASWHFQKEYSITLLSVPRIVFSSIVSFFISEFLNSYLIATLKVSYQGKKIWMRMIISSLMAITIDNFIFLLIAYYKILPITDMLKFSTRSYLLSLLFEWSCIPIIIIVSNKLKFIENIDIFDIQTKFTPFSLDVDY